MTLAGAPEVRSACAQVLGVPGCFSPASATLNQAVDEEGVKEEQGPEHLVMYVKIGPC